MRGGGGRGGKTVAKGRGGGRGRQKGQEDQTTKRTGDFQSSGPEGVS